MSLNEAISEKNVMATTTDSNNWMVRRASGQIEGPFSLENLKIQISQGSLVVHDEICEANKFWITLGEGDELWKQLQIRMPREATADEVTQNVEPGRLQDSKSPPEAPPPQQQSAPGVETPSVWRGVAWILVTGATISLYVILRILRNS